jgi:hypothetical protein
LRSRTAILWFSIKNYKFVSIDTRLEVLRGSQVASDDRQCRSGSKKKPGALLPGVGLSIRISFDYRRLRS